MDDIIIKTLSEFGVPTLVCFFLLFKGSKSMDALTHSINELVQSNGRVENSVKMLEHVILSKMEGGERR